jgi:hypothetical protein
MMKSPIMNQSRNTPPNPQSIIKETRSDDEPNILTPNINSNRH